MLRGKNKKANTVEVKRNNINITKDDVVAAIVATVAVDITVAAVKFVGKKIVGGIANHVISNTSEDIVDEALDAFNDLCDAMDGKTDNTENNETEKVVDTEKPAETTETKTE